MIPHIQGTAGDAQIFRAETAGSREGPPARQIIHIHVTIDVGRYFPGYVEHESSHFRSTQDIQRSRTHADITLVIKHFRRQGPGAHLNTG